MSDVFFEMLLLTMLPWVELRGGIPFGLMQGLDPALVFASCVLINIAVLLPIFLFLDHLFPLVRHWKVADYFVKKTQEKSKKYVNKWGFTGLALFVAIPLPGSGAYAGALAAYLFGFPKDKAFQAISVGVFASGVIVLALCLFTSTLLGRLWQ